jgi:uncharacterized protein (DUF2225 family)
MINEESFICPIDGNVFEDGVVVSTNQMGAQTDFKPVVGGLFPFPFFVHACPSCGFASDEEGFGVQYDEDFKNWVKLELAVELKSGPLYGGLKYLLFARCAEKLGKPVNEVADLYLRGAWCAQEEETPDLESRCRKEALKHFEQALKSGDIEAKELATLTYLVGELYRRLGDTQTAASWFDKVESEIVDAEKQAWILKIAEIQKNNPVDIMPEDLAQ